MKPTCGPLPWVTTTPQPVATIAAMWRAVSRAFSYCSSIEPRWPSRMSAFPPIATTARRSIVMPPSPSGPADPERGAEGGDRAREAGQRRAGDPRADLADARPAVGDPRVDDRRDPGVDDPAGIDPGRGADEPEGWQRIRRVAGERDPPHQAGELQGVGRAAAHEADDGRCRGHRKPADPERLRDRAVAEIRIGVVGAVAREVQAVRDPDRRREPRIPGAGQADPEIHAVAGHRGHDRRRLDPVRAVQGGLASGHRQVEEEVVVAVQEVEDRGAPPPYRPFAPGPERWPG